MAVIRNDRFYKEVAANSTDTKDYVVPNGEVLKIYEAYGHAGKSPDTIVCITWDPDGANQILFFTHGDALDKYVDFEVTGDGAKKLRLQLTNDQSTADFLGCGWRS